MDTPQSNTPANDQDQVQLKPLLKTLSGREGTNACLFNLIVYTQESRRTAYFNQMVKIIRNQFPCRIIFITANPAAQEQTFRVSAIKQADASGSEFLCDQILIETTGQEINRTYFLLYPLFVPDLPIYLLWGQDPTTEHTILPHLENFSTRIIFDADSTEHLQQFSLDMLDRLKTSSIDFVDMNWARIDGWREVLPQIYDSPERFSQLANSNSVEITYNNRSSELFLHPTTQSIYLQAWLASRLKWEFVRGEKENGAQILYYKCMDRTKIIRLNGIREDKFESGDILDINVLGDHGYECRIQRTSSDQVKVQASNQFQCELPFVLLMPTLRSGRSFMQEIFYQKASTQYEQMLELISLTRWEK